MATQVIQDFVNELLSEVNDGDMLGDTAYEAGEDEPGFLSETPHNSSFEDEQAGRWPAVTRPITTKLVPKKNR